MPISIDSDGIIALVGIDTSDYEMLGTGWDPFLTLTQAGIRAPDLGCRGYKLGSLQDQLFNSET